MVDIFGIFRSKKKSVHAGTAAVAAAGQRPPQAPRIFISYATADGAEFASQLRHDLEAEGHSIWQDIAALEGGRDWWAQIEAALKSVALQHLVLVLTPIALCRPIIFDEIHLAREQGKTVIPVRGPGFDDYLKLPRHIGQVLDLAKPEHHTTFLGMLAGPSLQKPVPMMIPRPPADYVPRKAEIDALKARLLDPDSHEAVAIAAALRGTTGYGKTTLARALAYDNDIRDAYFDGTLFVELGQQGRGRIAALIADIVGLIDPERRRDFVTIDGARTALGEALGNRRFLLVIDDVWTRADLMPFLHGGPNTTRLITTRFAGELPPEVVQERVAAMTGGADGEAWQMLAAGLPPHEVAANKGALVALAERRHNWPQALRLANGFLRTRMGLTRHERRRGSRPAVSPATGGGSLAEAIEATNAGLDSRGGTALDPSRLKPAGDGAERYEQRHASVAEGMDLNLSLLDEANRARFSELAVFPEDVDVPIGIVARLWAETGGMDRHATEGLLAACDDASLLLDLDFDGGTFRFHDSVREHLHDRAGKAGLVAQHKRLVAAMGDVGGASDAGRVELDYFYRYLPEHLHEAGEQARLAKLLMSPSWMQQKLEVLGPRHLVDDYRYARTPAQNLAGRAVKLASNILARDHCQLAPQLLGRLRGSIQPEIVQLLSEIRNHIKPPAVIPRYQSLTPPGAEVARLEGHTGLVRALAVLPDGRLASGSGDETIRLWDPTAGVEIVRLEGHTGSVRTLAVLPDGRLASGSNDRTIRLWDPKSGVETIRLEGHTGAVTMLTLLTDGRLASASHDTTIRLWDTMTGAETARFESHVSGPLTKISDSVEALAVLPDGRLASGSIEHTIRLLDPTLCAETSRLDGHARGVVALAVLTDGQLASGSHDTTIRLWDSAKGTEAARLEGHTGSVLALVVLPDGRLASGSNDDTIRLWDPRVGVETGRLEGHTGAVTALAMLPDGRLASASHDKTIRLWDPKITGNTARPQEHMGSIWALTVLADKRLASASSDTTVRLWNPKTGAEIARLEGHVDKVTALAALADGRLASGSRDGTIRLWCPRTCNRISLLDDECGRIEALAVLTDGRLASGAEGGTIDLWDLKTGAWSDRLDSLGGLARALALLPNGELASASSDKTIHLWDPKTGAETARLEGHADSVTALAVLTDGRLASGSYDSTIRLWNLNTRKQVALLEGHSGGVAALAVLPDGRLASASYDKAIRLWDPRSGVEAARLVGHVGSVITLAILPDGRFASGSHDNTIRLWDPDTRTETARLTGHRDGVAALAMLPDGRLASASHDKTIRLWDVKTGAVTALLEGHAGSVMTLAVLADGRLASGSGDSTIRLWDVEKGTETANLDSHTDGIVALAVLPDGHFASSSHDRTIRVWDLNEQEIKDLGRASGSETILGRHSNSVTALAVLSDGRLASGSTGRFRDIETGQIASTSDDNMIRLWDLKSGIASAVLSGHLAGVEVLALLTDGRLASGSHDNTIRLWDIHTGAEITRLEGHVGRVMALAVMPDGRLASGSTDKTIRLWDLKLGIEIARLEVDAAVHRLAALADGGLVAGDELGRLHWLEIAS